MTKRIPYLQIAMIAALLVAVFCRMPYGYYTLLKVICCAGFAYLAYKAHGKKLDAWMWTFGVVAVVYNPFVKIHLGREIWTIVNLATIALAGVSIKICKGGSKNELWLGNDNSGVRFTLRKSKNGQLRVEACATSYPGEHALLTADECKRCITSIERDSDDELRLHPEGFGCLSFDVSKRGLGIDHHLLYDWPYQERQRVVGFLKMCVAKMET